MRGVPSVNPRRCLPAEPHERKPDLMDASPDGRSHLVDFARQRLFPAQVGYLPGHHSSVRRRAAYARAHSYQGAAMTMTDHEQDDNTAPLPTVLRPRSDTDTPTSLVPGAVIAW